MTCRKREELDLFVWGERLIAGNVTLVHLSSHGLFVYVLCRAGRIDI